MLQTALKGRNSSISSSVLAARLSQAGATTAARAADGDAFAREALARNAPWLAGLSTACAVIVAVALRDSLPLPYIVAWLALAALAGWLLVTTRRAAAEFDAPAFTRSRWLPVLETAALAGLWGAPAAFAFNQQPSTLQLLLGGAMATMMAGAFLLAAIPVAATLWLAMLAMALTWAIGTSGAEGFAGLGLLIGAYSGMILVGCITFERLATRNFTAADRERARADTVLLLLKEYEEQGIGWLWQIDANNCFTYVSPGIRDLLGLSTGQLTGQSMPALIGAGGRLGEVLIARAPFAGLELELPTSAGARWIAISGNPITTPDGAFEGFRGVGMDITETRRSQDRLRHLASIDVLTGLPNRQKVREIVEAAVAEAERTATACAILFLDLDGFKPVNDSFGHLAGDAVLCSVADRLTATVGARGQVGRLGGDEFAIVIADGHNRHVVEELGLELVRVISEPFRLSGGEARIGVSIGCTFGPIDGRTVDDLLLKADLALYQAKSRGRGAFCQFDAKMQRDVEDRQRLEQDLRDALPRNQFVLYYQPVVSAQTQAVTGFEALLRWKHPERGMVRPDIFIPILEEMGLIAEIGEWVLKTACRDAMTWPQHISISVNVSARQLVLPALPNAIREALTASRLAPNRLELEVTESIFMSDSDGSLDVLRRVRAIGVGIALDDFGTGYSSLGYLNKTVFHTLKIDGSFVRDTAHRNETVLIIQAIVQLANSFRMSITAEGVETVADFERMRDLGCHKIQGYLFGKPMPFDETVALVGTQWDQGRKRAI